jgi:hypothetical protein
MGNLSQAEVEALYSQRQVHTVLHESIRHELNGFLINWSLRTWYAIENYLEKTYPYESKNLRIATLKPYVEEKGIEYFLIKIMAAVIHTDQEQTFQQVIGYLAAFMPHEMPFDRAITAGELIALGSTDSRRGMYSIVPQKRDMSIVEVNYWNLVEQHLTDSLDWINDTTFNPPLVEPPKEVTSNRNCGFHKIQEPVILGSLTDHDEQQNLDAINQLNEIEWVLDPHVLAEPEVPGKPFEDQQSHENFVQMAQESKFIYRMLGDKPFWLAWQYDCRGRMYSHGYHVNLQAAEYKKALLNFNHYEELT